MPPRTKRIYERMFLMKDDLSTEFLAPKHRLSFLWAYVARKHIVEAIRPFASTARGAVLDVGCGRQPYRSLFAGVSSYIGVDVPSSPHRFGNSTVLYDGKELPFGDCSFNACLSSEVFEHVREPCALLRECRRVLAPGGRLFLTVPFVFPQHEAPQDFWRFTRYGLEAIVRDAGFANVSTRPLGGYSAAMAHVLGLYANQRLNRYFLRPWCYPLVWLLQRVLLWFDLVDSRPQDDFTLGWALEGVRGP